jgi:uncharacterized protein DUF1259
MSRSPLWSLALVCAPLPVRAQLPAVWDSVGRALQASPVAANGYVRYNFPRRDLTLKVGDVAVSSRLALGAWAGFAGTGPHAVVMGDLVLTAAELLPVEAAIDSQHLAITGVHNHLLGDTPRITYVHFHGEGSALDLARRLDRVLAHTATPRGMAAAASAPVTIDTALVFASLGARGPASGNVAQVSLVLVTAPLTLHGQALPAALAAGSPVNVQAVSTDRMVATGDFAVTAERLVPLTGALTAAGITITSMHNHLVGESPPLYYVHFWADGRPLEVLGALAAAIDSARSAATR